MGWLWTFIDFIIFGIIAYNQFMCFFNTLADVEYNSYGSFSKYWGIYSWIWGIIIGVISSLFFPVILPFVGIAFVVCQLVQNSIDIQGSVAERRMGACFSLSGGISPWIFVHGVDTRSFCCAIAYCGRRLFSLEGNRK